MCVRLQSDLNIRVKEKPETPQSNLYSLPPFKLCSNDVNWLGFSTITYVLHSLLSTTLILSVENIRA